MGFPYPVVSADSHITEPPNTYIDNINKVSKKDIIATFQKYIDVNKAVTIVVGGPTETENATAKLSDE